jgi:hypothetical protein
MPRRLIRALAVLSVILFIVVLAASGIPGCLWAGYLESKWDPAKPRTRAELEQHLFLYSVRSIAPSESLRGRSYRLNPNESMVQYLILWSAPLDVVYDDGGQIQRIFTSYK